MNNPESYAQADELPQKAVREFLKEYIPLVRWKQDTGGCVMDIGCGPGKVTTQILLPMLPESLRELVATDVSPQMIEYAQQHHKHPRVSYNVLDIATKMLPQAYYERFDQVFSFFCIHMVQDQRQAMQNIFDMLQSGGDILLLYLAKTPLYEVMWKLANIEQWKPYIKDAKKYIGVHQFVDNVEESLYSLLQEVGFTDITCRRRCTEFVFKNVNVFMDLIASVDPFIPQIPEHLNEKYRQEREHEIQAFAKEFTDSETDAICFPYTLVHIHARKP